MNKSRELVALRVLWALPCSCVGGLLGLLLIACGGSARRVGRTVEVGLAVSSATVPGWARSLRFSAITFGHVVLGQCHESLAALRDHERVHVRQYEVLGPLFFVAYLASSLWVCLQGRCPYRSNYFEKQAFAAEARGPNAAG